MRIIAVNGGQGYSGILLPDLEAVKKALYAYAEGVSSTSNATRQQQPGDILMLLDLVQGSGNRFIESLYEEIESALRQRSQFSRHFDYDGAGRFLKTSVDVNKVPEGYVIGFSAAYVGRQPETDLAEYLGAIRGLLWSRVDLTLEAAYGNEFRIDFQPIMDALADSDFADVTAEEVASTIAAGYKEEWSNVAHQGGIVRLFNQGSFAGSLSLDRITVGRYNDQPYISDGSIVAGLLCESWEDKSKFEHPRVTIMLEPLTDDGRPILDLDRQAQLLNLTENLRSRLASLVENAAALKA